MTVTIGRRELLAALGGAAVAWPLAARSRHRVSLFAIGGRVHRIKQSARCGPPGLRFRPRRSRRQ
jgi:hypothetical protein